MPVISVTRLRVRSWRFLLPFLYFAARSYRQAKTAAGNLDVALLHDSGKVYWTWTVWTNAEAMKAFMLAGPHRHAMRKLLDWCDEAALVEWLQETDVRLDWKEAHLRLQREGRRSSDSIAPDVS